MDITRAKEIISALAEGVDPTTGEILPDNSKFKKVILAFREYYGLAQYNLKEIDQYLWQLGKEYYPNNYGAKK